MSEATTRKQPELGMRSVAAGSAGKTQAATAASYLALVAAGSFWGLGFVFGKYALAAMPVDAMVTYRFAVAALALTPVLFLRRIRIVPPRDILFFALAALLFVPVQFLIQFHGLALTSVTHASLMVALMPVFIAMASFAGRRPGAAQPKWFAVGASFVGAALVVFGPAGNFTLAGDALVTLSLLAAVAWIVVTERTLKQYDPIAASAWVLLLGTAMLVAFELIVHPQEIVHAYPASAWIATVACGIVSTAVATVFWNVGLQRVPSSDAGVFINLEPLVGSACGVAFFGDSLGWQLVLGAALVIAAAVWVTMTPGSSRPAAVRTYSRSAAAAR